MRQPEDRMTMAYGAPAFPSKDEPQPLGKITPQRIVDLDGLRQIAPHARTATVNARVTEDGKLMLRISADGVHIAEVEGLPAGVTLTVTL